MLVEGPTPTPGKLQLSLGGFQVPDALKQGEETAPLG